MNYMAQGMKKYFSEQIKDWNLFEKTWLLTFTAINLVLFFIWQDNIIGLIASLTGMMTVVLVAKGKITSYYFGFVNILAYAYIAYQSKYFGEVMLNILYFLPMQIIGLYYWTKNRNKQKTKDDVIVKSLTNNERIKWLLAAVVGIVIYGIILSMLDNTLPFVDSTTTILQVIAMILLVKRATEQWLIWIVVNIISIAMWSYIVIQGGSDITIVVMWTAYLVNSVYGYINWRKLELKQNEK